jgi:2-hydroxychromene-2-carboxylate isomerase
MEKSAAANAKLAFWYDFASTYSYLSAMRIEAMAKTAGVDVVWRPFLLGPIFKAQGWTTSPFNLYPAKGRYMVRDLERISGERGLPFVLPKNFPVNSLLAARLATQGDGTTWIGTFTRAVFAAQFMRGEDISDRSILSRILVDLGLDADRLFAGAESPAVKLRLREQTEAAQALGIFGAPSFTVNGELFWGDDRLEPAVRHAMGTSALFMGRSSGY